MLMAGLTSDVLALCLVAAALLVACLASIARSQARARMRLRMRRLNEPLLPPDVEVGSGKLDHNPVNHSVVLMSEALAGEGDLAIDRFAVAGQHFCEILQNLGPFAMVLKDVRQNLDKIRRASCRTSEMELLRQLLEAECKQRVHSKPGRLADPSAAIGLLWTCRFMRFWEQV